MVFQVIRFTLVIQSAQMLLLTLFFVHIASCFVTRKMLYIQIIETVRE